MYYSKRLREQIEISIIFFEGEEEKVKIRTPEAMHQTR